ncbi:uncharacterized protein LOC131664256 isoform X2 [Phymastichus coffea]|nr:uncharacterized protein LOC131664256 isoform X2 [Phymastichus coffea]XP_058791199.1 uncharacterized protein LOC131664256 isoform X2 [Phymastichus coffea]XP_058791201.1 uncharacterized protein LOC131664256 isoform X2 [Phymastichus coffea]
MVYTAVAYLALAGAAWLFLRLIQACFWLPSHMRRQNDVQTMLQDKIDGYERYMAECERNEAAAIAEGEDNEAASDGSKAPTKENFERKRKERQECLDMLKTELRRIQDGGDPYDFDYLLDDETKKLLSDDASEKTDEDEKDTGSEKVAEDDGEPKKDK